MSLFLNNLTIPQLSEEQKNSCEGLIPAHSNIGDTPSEEPVETQAY